MCVCLNYFLTFAYWHIVSESRQQILFLMVYHGSRVSSILIRFKVRVAYGPKYVSDALAKEKKNENKFTRTQKTEYLKDPAGRTVSSEIL